MHQLCAATGCPRREVTALKKHGAVAAQGGIERRVQPGRAPANDRNVERLIYCTDVVEHSGTVESQRLNVGHGTIQPI